MPKPRPARHRCRAALLAALLAPPCAAAAVVSGQAEVIDGDSLRIGRLEIRLHGIDAPEALQSCERDGDAWPCGRAAANLLRSLTAGAVLSCEYEERDAHGRALARCRRGSIDRDGKDPGGIDVNAAMVELGLALAYRRYSDRYVEQERLARSRKRGMWAGEFVEPWAWRRAEAAGRRADADCPVKGNVNRRGDRIYHVRGSRDYARVRLRDEEGDRCFETETGARAAGFRPPAG